MRYFVRMRGLGGKQYGAGPFKTFSDALREKRTSERNPHNKDLLFWIEPELCFYVDKLSNGPFIVTETDQLNIFSDSKLAYHNEDEATALAWADKMNAHRERWERGELMFRGTCFGAFLAYFLV